MSEFDLLETVYVGTLFGGYLALWKIKQREQIRQTGEDPEVMHSATDPLQRYLDRLTNVFTGVVVILVAVHAAGLRSYPGLERLPALEARWADHAGLAIGVLGLAICRVAQVTMGASWRVGIDERRSTPLLTSGIFQYVRNPTYLGLFLVNAGFWLIWPTWAVGTFVLFFCFFLEIQVRCEEQHLKTAHGDSYLRYMASTKRYFPWLY